MTKSFPTSDFNGMASMDDPPEVRGIEPPIRRIAPGRGFWMQKDGSKIAFKDMEDKHIINCIKMFQRYGRSLLFNIGMSADRYAAEHDSMGGLAAMNVADEAFSKMDGGMLHEFCLEEYPKYRELVKEAQRRNLEWATP